MLLWAMRRLTRPLRRLAHPVADAVMVFQMAYLMWTGLRSFRHQCGECRSRNQAREKHGFHSLHLGAPIKAFVNIRDAYCRDGRHAVRASLGHWDGCASSRRAPSNDGRHSTGPHATQL